MPTKTPTIHICTECINEFHPKDLFIATKSHIEFYTLYCHECIKKLNITDYKPFQKPRKKKA